MDSDEAAIDPSTAPLVTVLVPARNEQHDIERCLAAVAGQDLDHRLIEVVVATADSADDTAEVARRALRGARFARVRVLSGGPGTTPENLNAGLAAATGKYLCRVDARSVIPGDYVRRCVELLDARPEVAVTGGAQVAIARDRSATAVGIARALNNRYGMGLSKYRSGAASGPTDTVYLGAFRTEELRAAGGWDERFATNQDFELNRRMGRRGVVWFESGIDVGYLPRRTVRELFGQYRRFGRWKVRYWQLTEDRPRPRQLVLVAAAPLGVLAGVVALSSPRRAARAAAVALCAAVAVERIGADEPEGSAAAHSVGTVALAAIASGWSLGVWESLLVRRRLRPSPAPAHPS